MKRNLRKKNRLTQMRHCVVACLLLCFYLVSSQTVIAKPEPTSVLSEQTNQERAEKFVKEGHYQEGLAAYKALIKSNPREPKYFFALGSCYQELRQYDRAHSFYAKAAALKPDDQSYAAAVRNVKAIKAAPLVQRGMEKQMHGDYAGAIADYRASLKINDDPAVHVNVARANTALGKKAEADAELAKKTSK